MNCEAGGITPEQAVATLWYAGELSYLFHRVQDEIYRKIEDIEAEEALFLLARQAGKTYFCVALAIQEMLQNDGVIVAVVAPNKEQAKEIITPKVLEIIADAPKGLIWQEKSTNKFKAANGSQLIVAGFDTAAESLRGKTLHKVILEGSGSFNIETYDYRMKSVLKPCLTHSKAKVKMIHATTLSPIEHHPVNNEVMEKTQNSGSFFMYTIDDNPLLSEERKLEIIEDYGGEDSPDYRREYLCEKVIDLSLKIIPSFSDENVCHIVDEREDQFMHQLTIDFGGSRDKTGIVLSRYNHILDQLEFIGERFLEENSPTNAIMKEAFELAEGRTHIQWYADAPGQLLVDIRNEYDINIRLPAKEDKESAWKAFDLGFKKKSIVVSPDCKWLIRTLKEGVFNQKRTDFVRSKELGHADMIAAGCYASRCRNEHWRPDIFSGSPIQHHEDGRVTYQGSIRIKRQEELNNLKQLAQALAPKSFRR